MGDEGRIYVSEDVVPAYKNLLRDADLILPNQFEAESGLEILRANRQETTNSWQVALRNTDHRLLVSHKRHS